MDLCNEKLATSNKPYILRIMEFSLNAFTVFAEFSDKKIKIKKENCSAGTQDLPCKRQRLYHSAIETQTAEQIFILKPIHFSDSLKFLNTVNSMNALLYLEKTPFFQQKSHRNK